MNNCEHLRRVSDAYGITCLDCGEILAGYGYDHEGKDCIHNGYYIFNCGDDIPYCEYCNISMEEL